MIQLAFRLITYTSLSIFCCTPLFAQDVDRFKLEQKTEVETLANGMKLIIQQDPRSAMVMSQIWYKVGSSDEPSNLLGISHLLEHMMFKGTKKVPGDEFSRLSARYGGSINAATSTNYTNYYQLYPKQYLPMALELEADRMSNLILNQADFEPELAVVKEERRQRTDDNPTAQAIERFRWITYPTSNYRNPTIGHMKNLDQLTLADVKSWYQQWYAPNNAILVIVGDVDIKQTKAWVKKYFANIAAKKLPSRLNVTEYQDIGYRHIEVETAVQVPNLVMSWNVPSLTTAKQPTDAYALIMINAILDGVSARLETKLVREQSLLTAVNASYDLYNRGDSIFSISALPKENVSFKQIEDAVLKEIELIQTELVSDKELTQVKTGYVSGLIFSQDSIATQARLIGLLEVNGLDYKLLNQMPQKLAALSKKDIQQAAKTYFKRSNLTTLYINPLPQS